MKEKDRREEEENKRETRGVGWSQRRVNLYVFLFQKLLVEVLEVSEVMLRKLIGEA